jgi:hypothetical protein
MYRLQTRSSMQTCSNLPSTPTSAAASFSALLFLSASLFIFLLVSKRTAWSLILGFDQLFGHHVVITINEKYGLLLAESLRRRTTSYDMFRRAASKATDDVVLFMRVLISA